MEESLREQIVKEFNDFNNLNLTGCNVCRNANLLDTEALPLFHKEGNQNARILFLMEAPNQKDTIEFKKITVEDSTDPTGKFIRNLIEAIGEPALVTNAVLCLPRKNIENKRTVTRSQLEACIGNLIQMINEVNPRIVIAFGKVAWNSTLLIDSHDSPFTKVPTSTRWNNRTLISTHHPSSLKKKGDKETVFQGIVTLINP